MTASAKLSKTMKIILEEYLLETDSGFIYNQIEKIEHLKVSRV